MGEETTLDNFIRNFCKIYYIKKHVRALRKEAEVFERGVLAKTRQQGQEISFENRVEIGRCERMHESLARELIARKLILPELKYFFGNNLGALLLIGSSQLGVRQASRYRVGSDLDLVCIFSGDFPEENFSFMRRMKRKVRRNFHFKTALQYYNPEGHDSLKEWLLNKNFSFQVLYGEDFARNLFGHDYLDRLPELRKKYLLKKELRYTFEK